MGNYCCGLEEYDEYKEDLVQPSFNDLSSKIILPAYESDQRLEENQSNNNISIEISKFT